MVMIMKSLWLNENRLPEFPMLDGEIKTDVLIIGAGLCGLLCAHELTESGVECTVIESGRVCKKTSGNTTAKITSQHGLIYKDIIKKYGPEAAEKYYRINQKAVNNFSRMCKEIECDFAFKDNYIYSTDSPQKLEEEIKALEKIKAEAELCPPLSVLPFENAGAVRFPSQAQFDPVAFACALVPKLNIYENSPVLGFDGGCYYGKFFKIKADKVIVATHFPVFNKPGSFSMKLYQHRSYVIALKNAPELNGMYLDESKKGLSLRNHGEYLLLGGGSHRTGKKGGNWKELRTCAEKYFPSCNEAFNWATQDCMSLDGLPYIGQYSKNTPNLFVATGFNKWGMSLSMASAMILKDLVFGKANEYADIFSPSRSVLHPQLAVNALETTVNMLTPTKPRCPHLGCAMKWNKAERSWDCPCHGSRFSENGRLLDNPANGPT